MTRNEGDHRAWLGWLREDMPEDLDSPDTTRRHRELIQRKSFLKKLYEDWYQVFVRTRRRIPTGPIVEFGSGGGFLTDTLPEVVTSEVQFQRHCQLTCSAESMPFADASVAAFFMVDVLHHLPNCGLFFREAERALLPGGRIVMIEPANTLFSRWIYRNLHHEPFEPTAESWRFPSSGPLSDANGALPWILFERDLEVFRRRFPGLELQALQLHTPFRYLITGGLSYRSAFPGWSFRTISGLEKAIKPVYRWTAMFQTIELSRATRSSW